VEDFIFFGDLAPIPFGSIAPVADELAGHSLKVHRVSALRATGKGHSRHSRNRRLLSMQLCNAASLKDLFKLFVSAEGAFPIEQTLTIPSQRNSKYPE
jgi:hypothetical protein